MMKKLLYSLDLKRAVLWSSVFLSAVIALLLWAVSGRIIGNLTEQHMADRWSKTGDTAQISCFFSANGTVSTDMLEELKYKMNSKLQEASIVSESQNPGARLWADTYSAFGQVSIDSENGSITADAVGVGGDFFLFHPLKLLYGSYFSGDDLMQDRCIIDQDAAWKLFGSNDVAGQIVYIRGIPHIVAGVIERASGKLEEAAGLDSSVVYLSYDSLDKYGSHSGINHYEVVMPNPVKDFAVGVVRELIGMSEQNVEIIDNSTRFDLPNRVRLIGSFGTRSMNGKAIIYPYWENIARGSEDILLVLTLFIMIFGGYASLVILIYLIRRWRRRTWNLRTIRKKITQGNWTRRSFRPARTAGKRKLPARGRKEQKSYEEEDF